MPTPKLSIVIPVHNEAPAILPLAQELRSALESADAGVEQWEALFVDDGSTDHTWQQVELAAASDPRIKGIRLRSNFGKSTALAEGLAASSGTILVTMDGDGQDDPHEIPRLVSELQSGADLVSGYKADRRDPLSKRLPSKLFNAVTSRVTGLQLDDHNCGLKVGWRDVFLAVPLYGELHRYTAALVHAEGYQVRQRAVNHRPRRFGRSKFGLERYGRGAVDLLTVVTLTRYGRRPGHLFGGVGLTMGIVAALVLGYLFVLSVFSSGPVGGRPLLTLGVLLAILSMQMISLGILAEIVVNSTQARGSVRCHVLRRTYELDD
jgi:glycosyltransferase involved in cell wall biosynthesis